MIKYYVRVKMKYARKKIFDTQTQAEKYYRELQKKYDTNALYIGVIWK